MSTAAVQLMVTVGVCAMICFSVLAIVYGEAQQIKKARVAARSQSASSMRVVASERSIVEAGNVFPTRSKQGQTPKQSTRATMLSTECEVLQRTGFTPKQIERLMTYRAAYRADRYQPDPLLPGRLGFARWLYQHGELDS